MLGRKRTRTAYNGAKARTLAKALNDIFHLRYRPPVKLAHRRSAVLVSIILGRGLRLRRPVRFRNVGFLVISRCGVILFELLVYRRKLVYIGIKINECFRINFSAFEAFIFKDSTLIQTVNSCVKFIIKAVILCMFGIIKIYLKVIRYIIDENLRFRFFNVKHSKSSRNKIIIWRIIHRRHHMSNFMRNDLRFIACIVFVRNINALIQHARNKIFSKYSIINYMALNIVIFRYLFSYLIQDRSRIRVNNAF